MSWNNGYETKKFEARQKKQAEEYRALGNVLYIMLIVDTVTVHVDVRMNFKFRGGKMLTSY